MVSDISQAPSCARPRGHQRDPCLAINVRPHRYCTGQGPLMLITSYCSTSAAMMRKCKNRRRGEENVKKKLHDTRKRRDVQHIKQLYQWLSDLILYCEALGKVCFHKNLNHWSYFWCLMMTISLIILGLRDIKLKKKKSVCWHFQILSRLTSWRSGKQKAAWKCVRSKWHLKFVWNVSTEASQSVRPGCFHGISFSSFTLSTTHDDVKSATSRALWEKTQKTTVGGVTLKYFATWQRDWSEGEMIDRCFSVTSAQSN